MSARAAISQPIRAQHAAPLQKAALLAGLLMMLVVAGGVTAQEGAPDREEAFVYATTHYDGLAYGSALVTGDVDTIYLMADVENIVAPRNTLIYYWALTNTYLADWARMNELVEGTLEISQNGQVIQEAPLVNFVIQYDTQDILNSIALYTDEDADAAFAHFQERQVEWQAALRQHFHITQFYQDEVRRLLLEKGPGNVLPEELPPEPGDPPQLTLFSTDPVQGYVVSLPEGAYEVQMRLADGTIHPNSHKRLVTFTPLREGVAYEVTPKSRWTVPDDAREPNGVLYAPPETTLYLRPERASEYNARAYTRMTEPQDDSSRADRLTWVPHQPMTDVTARIQINGVVEDAPLLPYYVRQLATDSRGYDIIPWDVGVSDQPSFTGFEVDVPAGGMAVIELVDAEGNVVPGSRREIRPLYTDRAWALYLFAALPLVVGALAVAERRSRARRLTMSDMTA